MPEESRYERIDDLAGATVATVYPRLTRELLPVEVELVDVTGSVEIAPRLGLADAIVDLVSSGNTLRTNGLRSLGRALLLAGGADRDARAADAGRLVSMMRAVVEARAHRYLMLNTPEARLDRGLRGHRLALAERAAARRARAWSPCTRSSPRPRSGGSCPSSTPAGASSILVVPVERMAR